MRVSQIQNLTWGANLVVLGGLVFVGMKFFEVNRQKAAKEPVWELVKAGPEDPSKRWPGDLKDFEHIWKTNVSGRVPPPPPPPAPPEKPDPEKAFRAKLTYLGGWAAPSKPSISTANVKFDNKVIAISPGISLDDFQLIQFTIVEKTDPSRPGASVSAGRLVFRNPKTGLPVEIEQIPPQNPVATGTPTPIGQYSELAQPVAKENGPINYKAFLDPTTGEWYVPEEEQLWLETFGEKKILANLATKPDVDAAGVSHGLLIGGLPEAGTPLGSHGVTVNDVLKSINGVAITSKEDIVRYFRGPGKGLEVYKVVVSANGAERTITYNVPRRGR